MFILPHAMGRGYTEWSVRQLFLKIYAHGHTLQGPITSENELISHIFFSVLLRIFIVRMDCFRVGPSNRFCEKHRKQTGWARRRRQEPQGHTRGAAVMS